jgi:NADPH-dependent glutamate synthase beta subunit-like oxidoreductase
MATKQGYNDTEELHMFGTSPCKAACPAHISIPGFISAISQEKYSEGLKLIKKEMPFPAICGRVCPHPCEEQCSRSDLDDPLSIMYLKRFLADEDLVSEACYVPEIKDHKDDKVAVIGAGPAGLTTAYYLAIEGYTVTVFEKLPVAGGMMAVGIPEFRLPRDILRTEIDVIEKLGVEVKLNCEIGKHVRFDDLEKEFDAVFIGVGCHRGMKLRIPGEEGVEGVIDGITFLRDIHLGNPPAHRGRLVVIGGGNTAVDCARAAKRLGYEDVTILYRRTREEMPAYSWEIEEALEEEIDIHFLTAPLKILAKQGKISGVECVQMSLGEPDESGRRRPVPIGGSEFQVKADVLVPAIGYSPDLGCLAHGPGVSVSQWDLIEADPFSGVTNVAGIFAGGDVVSGPSTVVEAVAFGKKAAVSIDRYLKGEDMIQGHQENWIGCQYTPPTNESKQKVSMPNLSVAERRRSFREINLGFTEELAKSEADRCYRICGINESDSKKF